MAGIGGHQDLRRGLGPPEWGTDAVGAPQVPRTLVAVVPPLEDCGTSGGVPAPALPRVVVLARPVGVVRHLTDPPTSLPLPGASREAEHRRARGEERAKRRRN